ncbi:LytR/AlgR family response regulator transcription factor [Pedobacter sandarakinus]|uniref:LytR/AlgR family response regulator transcription factor n=1 Tax=Pedobacter sandarakinus TaxID=353156 RepID=UPI002246742F|nr:LytTR family DNA-binding domain-containing protein [Pedobacter sandarakinus]MCX2574888.1 LytTR family DNA-binding domain-containing protein [Pedobacter sandarakinus]
MYKCIIVDDEPHAVEGLKRYIATIPNLELVNSFTDPVKALMEITAGANVDLILLDVDMPGLNGTTLAPEIRSKTNKLVFTTAHKKYAFEAFEVQADAFLLKPYTQGKFAVTINKLFPHTNETVDDFMFIKSKEENFRLIKVKYADIIAIESKLNYVQVHTLNKSILTYTSLAEISKKLKIYDRFLQFQRSFIISQDYIDYIEGSSIIMINGIKISVGEYYKKYFNEFISSKLFKAKRRT